VLLDVRMVYWHTSCVFVLSAIMCASILLVLYEELSIVDQFCSTLE
jgi:hypothetical protein